MNAGMLYALCAYLIWGAFPLYFKSLQGISAVDIMLHRIVWSLAFLLIALAWRHQWAWIRVSLRQPKLLAGFALSAVLLSSNWLIYIWAVNDNRVVDASLGYFINPLVNVLLAFFLLRERLRRGQWIAVAIAAIGVIWLAWQAGHPPWIGISLALTFGSYGLMRKTADLGPLEGLALETALLFPLAAIALTTMAFHDHNAFTAASTSSRWLLAAAGPITAIPLVLFATGARRIPFATLGILQYVTPSLQLMLGVWLYHEPFSGARLAGFAMIWGALLVYSVESIWHVRKLRAAI